MKEIIVRTQHGFSWIEERDTQVKISTTIDESKTNWKEDGIGFNIE